MRSIYNIHSEITKQVIKSYPTIPLASKNIGIPVSHIRRACKTTKRNGVGKDMGRAGGKLWSRTWVNPQVNEVKEPLDAIFATCAGCVGVERDQPFLSDEQREEIKHCPIESCFMRPFRQFKNKDY